MTIDITNPAMIDRQSRMIGLGLTPAQIAAMMNATDDQIAKTIEKAKAMIPTISGEHLERSQRMLKAFEIEASLRA